MMIFLIVTKLNRKGAIGAGVAASNGEVNKTSREQLYDDHESNNEPEPRVLQHPQQQSDRTVIYADIVPVVATPEVEDNVVNGEAPHVIYSELFAVKQLPLLPAHLQRGSLTVILIHDLPFLPISTM